MAIQKPATKIKGHGAHVGEILLVDDEGSGWERHSEASSLTLLVENGVSSKGEGVICYESKGMRSE